MVQSCNLRLCSLEAPPANKQDHRENTTKPHSAPQELAQAEAGLAEAREQLAAAQGVAAAAAAALAKSRRGPAEEERKRIVALARAFKAEHFSGAGAACRALAIIGHR